MSLIKFKIDEKSLFYGIKNDYQKGQTATVHTPLNQSKDPNKWHHDILALTKTNIECKSIPDMLVERCLRNTTSDANSQLNQLYVFNNLLLDGQPLNTNNDFCMYIKEEIDEFIINRKGKRTQNTHLGRLKLHYPISLQYKGDGFNIDNKEVLNCILRQNGGFAFVVRGFEYSEENNTLNFITTMVGPEGILLSNVFKRQKGTGKKLLLNEIDVNDFEFIKDNILVSGITPTVSVDDALEKVNKTRVENGKIGEEIIMEMLSKTAGVENLYHTSKDFRFSLYDIEFYINGVKKYVEVKATQGDKKIFNMSSGEIKFMNRYKDDYVLFLITNVKDKMPNIYEFTCDVILKLKCEHPTTRFFA